MGRSLNLLRQNLNVNQGTPALPCTWHLEKHRITWLVPSELLSPAVLSGKISKAGVGDRCQAISASPRVFH